MYRQIAQELVLEGLIVRSKNNMNFHTNIHFYYSVDSETLFWFVFLFFKLRQQGSRRFIITFVTIFDSYRKKSTETQWY